MKTSRWLVALYSAIIALGIIVTLPNVVPQSTLDNFPSWLPRDKVSLGLDLRGGSHLVLEVDAADLVKERLQTLTQDARRTLREAKIGTTSIRRAGNAVTVSLDDSGQTARAAGELGKLAASIGNPGLGVTARVASSTHPPAAARRWPPSAVRWSMRSRVIRVRGPD